MGGFSSIIGLSQSVANTLYEVINAVSTHAALVSSHGVATIQGAAEVQAKVDTHAALTASHGVTAEIEGAFPNGKYLSIDMALGG